MNHLDLFSGYGGFSLAAERNGFETVGFSEIDKYASAVIKYHWPNTKNYGDITKIDWDEVPDIDIVTGGSPCQDLSIAGKRSGLLGKRSGLFFEYMRCIREKKPKYFIWENVKGALSSNNGYDFATVLNEMAEAGYSLWWQVLNAKDFGVPQNRERIFVVGFRDRPAPEVFFERGDDQPYSEQDASQSCRILKSPIRSQGDKPMIHQLNQPTHSNDRVYGEDGLSPCLNTMQGGRRQPFIQQTPRGFNAGGEKEICPSISKSSFEHNNHLVENSKIRRLTPMECERLMGLPDRWTNIGRNDKCNCGKKYCMISDFEISDTQRYKLCGNGVVVNVVEAIIKHVIL